MISRFLYLLLNPLLLLLIVDHALHFLLRNKCRESCALQVRTARQSDLPRYHPTRWGFPSRISSWALIICDNPSFIIDKYASRAFALFAGTLQPLKIRYDSLPVAIWCTNGEPWTYSFSNFVTHARDGPRINVSASAPARWRRL